MEVSTTGQKIGTGLCVTGGAGIVAGIAVGIITKTAVAVLAAKVLMAAGIVFLLVGAICYGASRPVPLCCPPPVPFDNKDGEKRREKIAKAMDRHINESVLRAGLTPKIEDL
jgi:predicted membrane channel-forming protein YqfA (hemolysin III family)